MDGTVSWIALAFFITVMVMTMILALRGDQERADQKGGKHGNMKRSIIRVLTILAAALLIFIAYAFVDGGTFTGVFRRIERAWTSIANGRLNSYWLYRIGPYTLAAGACIILCLIFGISYKKKSHGISFAFSFVFGMISVIAAIISVKRWSNGRIGTFAGYALLAGSIIVTACMLILCFITSDKKNAERRQRWETERHQQREAEQQQRAQQAEERKAARDEKIEQMRNAVSAGTEKVVSLAKDSAAAVASTTKQILADGSSPVGGASAEIPPVGRFTLPAPETIIPQIGQDEYALEKIKGLHALLKSGFVTQEEFEQKKQDLLGKV